MPLPPRLGRNRASAPVAGATLAVAACLAAAAPARAAQIVEFNLGCASGDRSPMWIELSAADMEVLDPALGVQALDRNGALLWERRRVFGKFSNLPWDGTRGAFFLGTEACLTTYGDADTQTSFQFDAFMPSPMDTVAGTLVLFRLQGTTRVPLQQVRYGFADAIAAPPPGSSMQLAGGAWSWNPDPIARNYEQSLMSKGTACLSYPRFFLRQLLPACEDGGTQGQYLELEAIGASPVYDARVHVISYDRNGLLLSDLANPFGARAGGSCAAGSHWLIGGPGYAAAPGAAPDTLLPAALDPLGGRVEVRGQFYGLDWMLDSLSWGNAQRPRPPDGFAYQHEILSGIVTAVPPTPLDAEGLAVTVPGCAFGTRPPAPFVHELSLSCVDGGTAGQFVEIAARDGDVALPAGWRLRAFDRGGTLAFDLPDVFDAAPGRALGAGNAFLVAAPGHASLTGLAPDAVLPVPLDTLAGRVELVHGSAAGDVVESALAWGPPPLLHPVPGTSLEYNGRATRQVQPRPSPTDLAGRAHDSSPCLASRVPHGFVVNEVATRCLNGSTDGLFIELTSDSASDVRDPALGLRLVAPGGARLAQVFPLFPLAGGSAWPAGSHWLVAAPGFEAQNGLAPDAVLDGAPDADLAQVTVFRRDLASGADSTLSTMAVSGAPPAPGRSVVRRPGGGYDVSGVVTPTRFDGAVVAPGLCYVRARPEAVEIGELMLRCRDGGADAQYVELEASGPDASYAPDLVVREFDHTGALVAALAHPFGALEGRPWRAGRPFTLAGRGFEARFGLAPDAILPVPLDTLGGSLELVLAGSEGGLPLDGLRWGAGGVAVPPAGASFTRSGTGFTTALLPSPATLAADAERTNACLGVCPQRAVRMAFASAQLLVTPRASLSSFESHVDFDATRGEVSLSSGFDETRATLPDRFTVLGPAAGTPIALAARLEVTAHAQQACDTLSGCVASVARVALTGTGAGDSLRTVRDTVAAIAIPLGAIAGVPFALDLSASATGVLSRGFSAALTARVLFTGLPAGARVVSCYGYDSRFSKGVGEAQLEVAPGRVSIGWPVLDPHTFAGVVERREPPGDWAPLEPRTPDADGILRVIDRTPTPGGTYEYRLSWDDVFGHETSDAVRVDVPRRPSFGLLGVRPNPSRGVFAATVELADPGEARLEVLDVAGRIVASSRQLLSAGDHVIPLAPPNGLAPGLYIVRFHAQGLLAQTTAVVLR